MSVGCDSSPKSLRDLLQEQDLQPVLGWKTWIYFIGTKGHIILKASNSFPLCQKASSNTHYFASCLSADKLRDLPPLLLQHSCSLPELPPRQALFELITPSCPHSTLCMQSNAFCVPFCLHAIYKPVCYPNKQLPWMQASQSSNTLASVFPWILDHWCSLESWVWGNR